MKMRRASLQIIYDNADITADVSKHGVSLTYTDSIQEADDLKLDLEDKGGLWSSDWFPTKGSKIKAKIITEDWEKEGRKNILPCGTFEIDSIECSGPPDKVSINAVSVPVTSAGRSQDKTKAWENISLAGIAGEIAGKAGLGLMFEAYNPSYGRVDQVQMPDLKFLYKLCSDAGNSIKVTDTKIVIFDEANYEAKGSVRKIVRTKDDVIDYSFSTDSKEIYTEAEVRYHDPETGELIKGSFKPPNTPKTGHKLKVYERCDNAPVEAPKPAKDAVAAGVAKKKLREKNKKETTAKLRMVGDVRLVSGSTVDMSGWGKFDGKYIIERATHTVSSSGYTVEIELRRALEGY